MQPRAESVIREYLTAFSDGSSVLVAAPQLVDTVCAQQSLAGWHVTDCASRFERVAPLAADATTDELILGTSGTTGGPKLVRHDKSALRGCAAAIATRLALDRDRDYVSLANPRFAFGLSILHSHALAGVPVRFQSAPTSLEAWARLRATLRLDSSIYLAPHQSFMLAQDPLWRLDGPVELILTGSPVRRSMVAALTSTFPSATLVVMYGQAELGPRISIRRAPISEFEEGNTGQPLPGVRVRSAGHPGALEVDSPFRMTSYVDITGATIPAERPLDNPWLATGDHGFVSASGDVHVVQRSATDVNFLGTRVRLDQLRDAVRAVSGVLDVRAAAVPHDVYGQRPRLRVLVPHLDAADALERDVRRALAFHIGTAASAVIVELVDLASLPESGKL
ncbi:MAG: acyl--CoA ligase [Actinomycetota bacterium]|nr:acyl--CoA ligase [Actinomycetota bacterium]